MGYDVASGQDPDVPLASLLTVIVTTSPIPTHPSTSLLEETIASLRAHGGAGADTVRIVITCDGYKVREESKPRSGVVDADLADRYEERCAAWWAEECCMRAWRDSTFAPHPEPSPSADGSFIAGQ